MGVVAISLWSDPLEKTFEKLCSAVLSQGTRLKTSGDPEISDEKKVREELARKNLQGFGKTKVFEIHRSSEIAFPHSR